MSTGTLDHCVLFDDFDVNLGHVIQMTFTLKKGTVVL